MHFNWAKWANLVMPAEVITRLGNSVTITRDIKAHKSFNPLRRAT